MRYRIVSFICMVVMPILVSCSLKVRENPDFDCGNLAGVCHAMDDTVIIPIRDYFPDIGKVDDVESSDYIVRPFSGDCMDTVMLLPMPGTRTVSVVNVVSGNQSASIVVKRTMSADDRAPLLSVIATPGCDGNFTVRVMNSPANYVVLWQNTLLDYHFLSYRGNGEFIVRIPDNAKNMQESVIRIYSYNKYGTGNDIYVNLENGKVIMSSK